MKVLHEMPTRVRGNTCDGNCNTRLIKNWVLLKAREDEDFHCSIQLSVTVMKLRLLFVL